MAIHTKKQSSPSAAPPRGMTRPAPIVCFRCGDEVSFPAIGWLGKTAHVLLHVDCAADLAADLGRLVRAAIHAANEAVA